MLLHRVITALILLPLVIYGVLNLSTPIFSLILGAVLLIGAHEWLSLAELKDSLQRWGYLVSMIALAIVVHQLMTIEGIPFLLFSSVTFVWVAITIHILTFKPVRAITPGKLGKSILGYFVLIPTWAALVMLHGMGEDGPALVLFAMSLGWVADTGAYFAGRQWGNKKLSPHISPKKTREGVYGALVLVGLWSGLLIWLRPETGAPWAIVVVCLLVCVLSVVGDLFESLLKRQAGIKDSGNILPGHGGILDRLDSLTAVAPTFVFGLYMMGAQV